MKKEFRGLARFPHKFGKEMFYKIVVTVAVFWIMDFVMHFTGVGKSNYYYTIKFANSVLFAFVWFSIFDKRKHLPKFFYSVFFGTWVSFFYIISTHSGLVQFFGINALYYSPPFVVFGIFLNPILWWFYHIAAFYAGLEISELTEK